MHTYIMYICSSTVVSLYSTTKGWNVANSIKFAETWETLKAYRHKIQKRHTSLMDFENKMSNFPLKV